LIDLLLGYEKTSFILDETYENKVFFYCGNGVISWFKNAIIELSVISWLSFKPAKACLPNCLTYCIYKNISKCAISEC